MISRRLTGPARKTLFAPSLGLRPHQTRPAADYVVGAASVARRANYSAASTLVSDIGPHPRRDSPSSYPPAIYIKTPLAKMVSSRGRAPARSRLRFPLSPLPSDICSALPFYPSSLLPRIFVALLAVKSQVLWFLGPWVSCTRGRSRRRVRGETGESGTARRRRSRSRHPRPEPGGSRC